MRILIVPNFSEAVDPAARRIRLLGLARTGFSNKARAREFGKQADAADRKAGQHFAHLATSMDTHGIHAPDEAAVPYHANKFHKAVDYMRLRDRDKSTAYLKGGRAIALAKKFSSAKNSKQRLKNDARVAFLRGAFFKRPGDLDSGALTRWRNAHARMLRAKDEMTATLNVGTAPEMPLGMVSPMARLGRKFWRKRRKSQGGLLT